ncbi:MAG TPA: ABC transporter ATP-binding protein [Clostridiales bacterium]|nr:ABC transporter ATP-binding protein [Clostridiales bacterium]
MTDHNGTETVIDFRHVCKQYDEYAALKDVSMEIHKGEFITVIGSSGCGKTTMLKLMNGLIEPSNGQVFINGVHIAEIDQIALRRKIGYVIQSIGLFPHLSIRKNITFIPNILKYDKKEADAIAKDLITMVGLDESILKRYPHELSGGQKQRIGVARALAASPEILLMDEPFGALDEITRNKLQDEILRIHQELGLTIVFITHDLREATKLGDRIIVMNAGEITSIGTAEKIREDFSNGTFDFFQIKEGVKNRKNL